jgi:hypothetical protein
MKYLKLYQNYRQYIKEDLENEFPITYEEIEDTFLDYIDSGKIKSRELENWNNSLRWPRSISRSNLFYFLNNFEYCLILNGEFQEDPFYFVDDETDMDDYWKAKSAKESTNRDGIYFEMSLNCDFVNKFKSNLFDDTEFLISGYQNTIDSVYKRRLIFEMVKSIFYRFQKLHTNVDVFYRIRETYDCSGTHPFAVLQFKVEFPETISESINIKEFTPEFLDVDVLDNSDNVIGSLQLESYDGKNYTIIDANIIESERMKGYYRKAIIELLNQHPDITIVSVFRSDGADRAWKRLIETLPDDFGYSQKYYPEEKTLEYKLYKK